MLSTVFAENKALKAENAQLKFQLEQMRKLIFGSKSERFVVTANNTEQLNLFNTDTLSEKPEQAITETVSYQRKKKQGAQKAYRPLTFS